MTLQDELFKIPEWVADYEATLKVNPELAQAMLDTGMPSFAAGMVQAGERAYVDESPCDPSRPITTY